MTWKHITLGSVAAGFLALAGLVTAWEKVSAYQPATKIQHEEDIQRLEQRIDCSDCFDICMGDPPCMKRCRERFC